MYIQYGPIGSTVVPLYILCSQCIIPNIQIDIYSSFVYHVHFVCFIMPQYMPQNVRIRSPDVQSSILNFCTKELCVSFFPPKLLFDLNLYYSGKKVFFTILLSFQRRILIWIIHNLTIQHTQSLQINTGSSSILLH